MLSRKALSSIIGIMIMAVMLSMFIMLFTSLSYSFMNYASTLRRELDIASDIAAEEKLLIKPEVNDTHIILTITNKAPRDVYLPYAYFRDNNSFYVDEIDIKVPALSTVKVILTPPTGQVSQTLKLSLVAKRGSVYKVLPIQSLNNLKNFTKVLPDDPFYLINDMDIVDDINALVVVSHKNGVILEVDIDNSTILWSKDYLSAKIEKVSYLRNLDVIVASIITFQYNNLNIHSVVVSKGSKTLRIDNFYDYRHITKSGGRTHVDDVSYKPILIDKNQAIVLIPKAQFNGRYATPSGYSDYWLFYSKIYATFVNLSSPYINDPLLLQYVYIDDYDPYVTPDNYEDIFEIYPKFKAVGFIALNESHLIVLIDEAFYNGSDYVLEAYRCKAIKLSNGILVPPTLHAVVNGELSWYRSLYPCGSSSHFAYMNNTILVATGSYLYVVDVSGNIVNVIDYSPEEILFFKLDEHVDKLLLQLSNNDLIVLNGSLKLEEKIPLSNPILDAFVIDEGLIVFNETHAYNPMNKESFMVKLPSRPNKVLRLGSSGFLVASDYGLLYLKVGDGG